MTPHLQQALAELRTLPAARQDAIAAMILDELADEKRWDAVFAGSQKQLSDLASRACEQIKAGQTRRLVIDEL